MLCQHGPRSALLQGDIEQGKIDDQWFTPHWSVEYWRELSAKRVEGTLGLSELASEAAQNVREANALQDATSAAYWAYHTTRWAYFIVQGASSILLSSARNGDLSKGQLHFTNGPMHASAFASMTWVRLRCRSGQSGTCGDSLQLHPSLTSARRSVSASGRSFMQQSILAFITHDCLVLASFGAAIGMEILTGPGLDRALLWHVVQDLIRACSTSAATLASKLGHRPFGVLGVLGGFGGFKTPFMQQSKLGHRPPRATSVSGQCAATPVRAVHHETEHASQVGE